MTQPAAGTPLGCGSGLMPPTMTQAGGRCSSGCGSGLMPPTMTQAGGRCSSGCGSGLMPPIGTQTLAVRYPLSCSLRRVPRGGVIVRGQQYDDCRRIVRAQQPRQQLE
jgi:hypothetical protein